MRAMLLGSYEMEEGNNIDDIDDFIETVIKQWHDENEKVERLHFHFSGHGQIKSKLELETSEDAKHPYTMDPIGQCLIGNTGKYVGLRSIQYLLTTAKPEVLTITLDNCRVFEKVDERVHMTLPFEETFEHDSLKRMATFYASLDSHGAKDENSFTTELYKVWDESNGQILIRDICIKVNASWEEKKLDKDRGCTEIFGFNTNFWDDKFWPTSGLNGN